MVSWGCAATAWLAKALNSHPDIFCVHAANYSWRVYGNYEHLDGSEYIHVIANQGWSYAAVGDVHGVGRDHIPELRRRLDDRFNAAVIVREPIARLHSQLALFAQNEKARSWDVGYVDALISRTGIVLPANDYRCRLFVHAANMLNAILEERAVGRIYRSEDLTERPEALGDFVEEITRRRVSPSPAWLRSAIESPRSNQHAGPSRHRQFADWQVDVIRSVVDRRSWDIYEALGYPYWEQALEGAGSSTDGR